MSKREKIRSAVFAAVDAVNETMPRTFRIVKSDDAALWGGSGKLDSLGLGLFIVALELELEKEAGLKVSLTGGELSLDRNPFATVGVLIDYLTDRPEEPL